MINEQFKNFALSLWLIPGVGPVSIFKTIKALFGDTDPASAEANPDLYNKALSLLCEGRISQSELSGLMNNERSLMEKGGISFMTYWCPEYPKLLKEIYSQPVILFYKGNPTCLSYPGVAVVGARKSGRYAEQSTRNIIREISAYNPSIPIVSGLAYGIDTIAHASALESGLKTTAVLANGLLNVYPRENTSLADAIVEQGGCLITELPATSKPLAVNFPLRNRIISGLSLVTLVMEAGDRSGALITAKYALDQNREIYALPGSIEELSFKGCNRLIQQSKALLLTSAHNFLSELYQSASQPELPTQSDTAEAPYNGAIILSEIETNIMNALQKGSLNEEIISAQTGIPFSQLLISLSKMEIKNYVRRLNGGAWEKVS